MTNSYDQGNVVRVATNNPPFIQLGTPVDPDVVYLVVTKPDKVTIIRATYTRGTGDPSLTIVRDSAGLFHADLTLDQKGVWSYRWYSVGAGEASAQSTFYCQGDTLT